MCFDILINHSRRNVMQYVITQNIKITQNSIIRDVPLHSFNEIIAIIRSQVGVEPLSNFVVKFVSLVIPPL